MGADGSSCADTYAGATRAARQTALNNRIVFTDYNDLLAYIICEPCVSTKDTACVDVCPVDCIHPRKDEPEFATAEMLYIHPDECIDCGACVPACPVEAIYSLDETPAKWAQFINLNAQYYNR
jgi:ferredoxin